MPLVEALSPHWTVIYRMTRPTFPRWSRVFFGMIGLASGSLATIILGYLTWDKFILGQDIGTRPLLTAGVVLLIASFQFLTTGILAELMARTYFESSNVKPYLKRWETKSELEPN